MYEKYYAYEMNLNETLNETVEKNYQKWINNVSKIVPKEYATDVLHSVLLTLYDRNLEDGYIKNIDSYILMACKIAYYSKNSQYNKYNRKEVALGDKMNDIDYANDEDNEVEDDVNIWYIIDDAPFSWWEKELFKRKILEDKTFDELAKETSLTLGQVYYSYCKVRTYLKDKLNEKYNEE